MKCSQKTSELESKLFSWLDWGEGPDKEDSQPRRGRLPHPEKAYLKAYLVMVNEKFDYKTELYRYLCEHPPLVWVSGFRLVADDRSCYGFDVEASVPSPRHLRRKLGQLDPHQVDDLLSQTVQQAVV